MPQHKTHLYIVDRRKKWLFYEAMGCNAYEISKMIIIIEVNIINIASPQT